MKVIYKRIQKLMEDTGLGVAAFARKLGENRQRIQDIQSGKQKVPEEIIIKIVEIFKINPSWLITGEGPIYSHELPKIHPDGGIAVMPVDVKYARLDNKGIAVTPVKDKAPTYFHDLCNKKMPVDVKAGLDDGDISIDLKGTLKKIGLIEDESIMNSDSIHIDFKWLWGRLNKEQRKDLLKSAKNMVESNEIKRFMHKFAISLENI
jgi:transcriptional regulator with XRE-family HTH domain